MNFIKSYINLLFNRFFVSFLAILVAILSARLLLPEQLGALSAAIAIMSIIIRFGSLGLIQSSQHFGAKDFPIYKGYLGSLIISLIPIFIFITTLGLFIDILIISLFSLSEEVIYVITQLQIGLSLMLIHLCLSMYFLGSEQPQKYLIISIAPVFLTLVCILIGFNSSEPFKIVLLGWKLQLIFGGLLSLFFVFFELLKNKSNIKNLGLKIKAIYSYGLKSVLVSSISFLLTRISVLIAAFFSVTQVAIFVVARSFSEIFMMIYGALGGTLFSRISRENENNKAIDLFCITLKVSNLVFFITIFFLAFSAKLLIPFIFGDQYLDSVNVVYFLLPGTFFLTQQRLAENFLFGMGVQTNILYYSIPNLFLLSALLWYLTPIFGAEGMAIATSISALFSFTCIISIICKKYERTFKDCFFFNKKDITIIMFFFKLIKKKLYSKF
ncbi:polysaccharide biosynthesis C-terminal domain-containing protein [Gammaproteobacteria bacterium]|nr:polysaccharide biosynthesis C-terminal domain-containing protein [Gammaproteobacteria bacterium]